MKKPFLERLLDDRPIICDGAMGTMLDLYEYPEQPRCIHNLLNPDIVARIHREYIEAGAEIIETNTFDANRFRLEFYHLQDKIKEINRDGVEIAKSVAGDDVYVAGSIGPTGKLIEPLGKIKIQQVKDVIKEQAEILISEGVDLIILETFVSLNELDAAIEAVKEISDKIPLIAQKTFPEDGAILATDFPIEVVKHIKGKGVTVVGSNCTVGPQRMFSIIKSMYQDDVILSAQPAAGIPTLVDGRSVYHASPEYLATYAKQLVEAGVKIIGACCGSTPSHIRAIANAVKDLRLKKPKIEIKVKEQGQIETQQERGSKAEVVVLEAESSNFAKKIGKKFLTTVELDIPRGLDISSVIEGAKYLKENDIDAVNITDGARARFRMDPVAISHLVQTKTGIETITHITCRDRNLIGLQGLLLGAWALGVKNILAITGDPTKIGDFPQATTVGDVDSIGLIKILRNMNHGLDAVGNTIGEPTHFLIACAANPTAQNLDYEISRLEKKVEAGAQIVFTQPLYEIQTLELFIKKIEHLKIPVMLGVLPLRSYKHAEFLHNEVPGINIPAWVREKLFLARDDAGKVGIEIASQFLKEAKPLVQGVYLLPPFKKYHIAIEILQKI
ncbi:bifunctional homocysteine S-methyltransferase/methylenetetrahydrofolate reductase [Candidatus Kryptobacter tengchongensis]|uniref:bifunctional homocysteine S-methyltransferase/methylenetetrahydrofolate reductase n=1 Tax=Kryptobacter tengchongensis TaxID=1643429 RepID=UPI000707E611|nr:bifunctional homocysteine S-methyltransferase/methylenetetrahydrofolate reductase [Candidatus Kryptobacter tengchongensis]CUS93636.1 homocysteine S-methyltransferase [Candidatus Kryptobacter tengchongensis]